MGSFKDQAIKDTKRDEGKYVNSRDEEKIIKKLKQYYRMSKVGEEGRVAQDRKGTKLRNGDHWSEGAAPGTTLVTSNIGTSMYEKLVDGCTRNKPIPEVSAYSPDDDDAAALLESALAQVWDDSQMQQKIKIGALQAGFTRPVLHYIEWDSERRGGIGDINSRIIPAYRSIIDNRTPFVQEMEFAGFKEMATRAKLIQLFPDKATAIEETTESSSSSPTKVVKNPLREEGNGNDSDYPATLSSIQSNAAQAPAGTSWSQIGKGPTANPMQEEIEVVFLWVKDTTPIKREKVKLNEAGRPVKKLVRDEHGEIQFDTDGFTVVQGPFGAMNQPNIKPKLEDVMEDVIEQKYKGRRHIAWIPADELILWDVDWNAPIPLVSQRDSFALDGYWSIGMAQRLVKVTHARNIILTMILQNAKYSLSGTYLATSRSGLKGNKLIPKPGEVFIANQIDENSIKRFPTASLDQGLIQMLSVLEQEALKILNISPMQQGQAPGRIDGQSGLDTIMQASSDNVVALSQHIENTIKEWAVVVQWFIQNYYTHEHMVEIQTADGQSEWKAASALATRGQFAVKIETGVGINHSESAKFARALQAYQMGIYTIPTFAKMASIPHWRQALKLKGEIIKNPNYGWLLGASAAPPATQSKAASVAAAGKRSHHNIVSGK